MEIHCFASVWKRICFACNMQLCRIGMQICQVCGRTMNQAKTNICADCHAVHSTEWVYNRSVFTYSEFVKQIVWRYKYKGQLHLAKPLGLLMAEVINQYWRKKKFILSYVPLHKYRLAERGFNQSALLAKTISKCLKFPMIELLVRKRMTDPQSGKSRQERLVDLQAAFQVKQDIDLRQFTGYPILLVDDIYTTGTTLRECAKPLKQQGMKTVYSVTIAR